MGLMHCNAHLPRRAPRPSTSLLGALALLALPAFTACVRTETYDDAIAGLGQARAEAAQKAAEAAKNGAQAAGLFAEAARLNGEVGSLRQDAAARDARLEELAIARSNDAKKLDDLVALNGELSQRLRAAGQSVEALAGEKGSLAKTLADTRTRLEELRRQQTAAEARAAQFRELLARFRKMIDAGQLKVVTRDGRMLLELPNDVLFDSGRTDIRELGLRTLAEVAKVLATLPDRRFQVAGHTDDVNIQTARFPSNWELSTARAVAVVKLLIERGMAPSGLSAAGYGEFAPVATNDTAEGRTKNRRIEIALVPNLDELVTQPGGEVVASPGGAAR
jgi:chemotaxis protein MotB